MIAYLISPANRHLVDWLFEHLYNKTITKASRYWIEILFTQRQQGLFQANYINIMTADGLASGLCFWFPWDTVISTIYGITINDLTMPSAIASQFTGNSTVYSSAIYSKHQSPHYRLFLTLENPPVTNGPGRWIPRGKGQTWANTT